MALQQAIYTLIPFFMAIAISTALALFILAQLRAPGTRVVALNLLAMAAWAIANVFELSSADPSAKLFWHKMQFVGILTLAPAWLSYVMYYAGWERWLTRRTLAALSSVPALGLLLVFTNGIHSLAWGRVVLLDDAFALLEMTYGIGILIPALYGYLLTVFATVLLLQMRRRVAPLYRRQINALLFVSYLPWLAIVLHLLGWKPYPYFYSVPFALAVTSLISGWNVFGLRLGEIVPVAREAIIEGLSDGVIVLDAQDHIVDLNPTAQGIIGAVAPEVIGQPIERVWLAWPALAKRLRQGQSEQVSTGLGARQHTFNLRLSPLFDNRGQLFSRVIVLHDVTELQGANEALRQARDELDLRVQERTAELERSNQELQQFAYVASHDLQEPLRMVTSYVQLLAQRYQGQLDADADDFIAFAVDGATRMQQLIQGLLAYSRVGTHGQPWQPTDCQTVLAQVLVNLQITIAESDAVVTHDPLPTVLADPTQLSQVFQNLIANAIKFRAGRRPEIHVGARRRENEWLFSVCDNGIGIAPAYAERVFLIFQRLHTRDAYPGTGIGLAICKRIVERHGGRIWLAAQPSQGATFYFTLPDRGEETV